MIQETLKTNRNYNKVKDNYLFWDISPPMITKIKNKLEYKEDEDRTPKYELLMPKMLKKTSSTRNQMPSLPLKDVPMHDLVKKLAHEFELEGDEELGVDLNGLWIK